MFPDPQNYICFPVPFIFRLVLPCSPEINDIIPLFPLIPGRALYMLWVHIWNALHYENKNCGYTLEVPLRGTSNEYPQYVFFEK